MKEKQERDAAKSASEMEALTAQVNMAITRNPWKF